MNILSDIYFGFGFFFVLLILLYLKDSDKILGEPKETNVSELSSYLLSSIFVRVPYMIWVILGLLTSQWLMFLLLIVVTGIFFVLYEVIDSDYINLTILKISILFEFVVTGFICLNYFHLGIKVSEFIL